MNTSFAGDDNDLSGSELIAMEGESELMGFSIGRTLRKTKNAVKKGAKVIGRNAGNIAIVATVVPTGGLSLLAKKKARNVVGSAARATHSAVLRPVAGAAMNVARSKVGGTLISKGLTAGASFVPGGSAALAATRKIQALSRSKKPAGKPASKSVVVPTQQIKRAARPLMPAVIPAAPVESAKPFLSKPVLIAGAAGLGLLGVVLAMSGRKR